jgi:alpha-galactosidase
MSSKITELQEPQRGWRYHSGQAIYVERFREGRLMAADLQVTGVPCHTRDEDTDTVAFDLQVDGESLYFGWDLAENHVAVDPASGCPEAVISLKHTAKPLRLDVRTMAAGDGFFRRRMTLTNLSADKTLALTAVTPLAGSVFGMADSLDTGRMSLAESGGLPYRVGWMRDNEWGQEGNFQWQDIPLRTELAFGSTRGRSGHTTPFAVAHNNVFGGYFVASLAWSANWRMAFTCELPVNGGRSRLRYALMPVAPAPMRLIAPGETLTLPDVHFGLNHESFDHTIQAWHTYQRRHVLPRVGDGRQPFIYNHWGFTEHELSEESLRREMDIACEVGAELFMVDAGWYADANTPWYETSGDWQVGNRLPNGLEPVFDLARSRGLLCGLWVEIESAGKASKLAAAHPDWFISRYGKAQERILDLAKPEVRQYVEDNIVRLIERYRLDMFRLDYNLDAREGGFNERDGRQENTLWRHVEAIYAIFDKVRARYPNLQLENCSSGGGRTDIGLNSRFTTAWISDWMRMPRTLRILNGMSLAMPAEYLDRMFGVCMFGSYKGNPETQLQAIVLAHPTISGLTPSLLEGNPDLLALAKKYVALYKDFIRPWHRDARLYHHTPVIPGIEASGWCALENVSADRTRAVAGVFRLINAREDTFPFRFRGLDPARRYQVTTEPGSVVCEVAGFDLQERGLCIHLDTPLTSRLMLCEAIA